MFTVIPGPGAQSMIEALFAVAEISSMLILVQIKVIAGPNLGNTLQYAVVAVQMVQFHEVVAPYAADDVFSMVHLL